MEPDRKIIKQYYLNNDVRYVIFKPSILMIHYEEGGPEFINESEWSIAEKHIKSYIEKRNKSSLLRTEVDGWTDIEIPVKNPSSNPTNWPLIVGLIIIVGAILLSGLIIFLKRKSKIK